MVKTLFPFINIILCIITVMATACTPAAFKEALNSELQAYQLQKVDTLVDIGCGNGYYAKYIHKNYPHTFLILEDLPYLVSYEKKGQPENVKQFPTLKTLGLFVGNSLGAIDSSTYKVVIGSHDTIPLASERYARILCRRSLHEFKNRTKMVAELTRILSKRGVLSIAEILPKELGEKDPYCMNPYLTKDEIIQMFKTLTLTSDTIIDFGKDKMIVLNFTK